MEEQNKNPEKKENEVQTSPGKYPTECDTYQKLCTDDSGRMLSLYTGYRLCKMSSMELTVAAGAFLRQESVS